jgi:hypothetical protein
MRWYVAVAAGVAALVAAPLPAEEKDNAAPTQRWARGVADDFWAAVLGPHNDFEQAAGLLSPELIQAIAKVTPEGAPAYLQLLRLYRWGNNGAVTFDLTEVAPDRSEVLFKGVVAGEVGKADFTMRVGKQPGGTWRVRYLLITARKGPEK